MKHLNKTEAIAFKQHHPKSKATAWQVVYCNKVVYEHTDIRLVQHYIKVNSLNCKPTAKY